MHEEKSKQYGQVQRLPRGGQQAIFQGNSRPKIKRKITFDEGRHQQNPQEAICTVPADKVHRVNY